MHVTTRVSKLKVKQNMSLRNSKLDLKKYFHLIDKC